MKKSTRYLLLAAAAMIVLGIVLCQRAWSRGENIVELAQEGAFTLHTGTSPYRFGDSDYTVCRDGQLRLAADEISTLELDWLAGSVTVETHAGDELLLREESARSLNESQRMRWRLSGGRLSLRYCAAGETKTPIKRLTVLVPADWAGESLSVDTASAAVHLSDLSLRAALSVNTASGAVELHGITAAALRVNTASGDVNLRGAGGEIDVDTASGRVTLEGLAEGCRVEADSLSGAVSLDFDGVPAKIDVDTASGAVRLRLPADTALALDFDTLSGRLRGEFLRRDGGVPVEVDTVSGDLSVEYR